jgi:hypothetical protein
LVLFVYFFNSGKIIYYNFGNSEFPSFILAGVGQLYPFLKIRGVSIVLFSILEQEPTVPMVNARRIVFPIIFVDSSHGYFFI